MRACERERRSSKKRIAIESEEKEAWDDSRDLTWDSSSILQLALSNCSVFWLVSFCPSLRCLLFESRLSILCCHASYCSWWLREFLFSPCICLSVFALRIGDSWFAFFFRVTNLNVWWGTDVFYSLAFISYVLALFCFKKKNLVIWLPDDFSFLLILWFACGIVRTCILSRRIKFSYWGLINSYLVLSLPFSHDYTDSTDRSLFKVVWLMLVSIEVSELWLSMFLSWLFLGIMDPIW